MSEDSLDLMKKMLVAEVGGMRKCVYALDEEKNNDRALNELHYLEKELLCKERDLLITDMLADFPKAPEVRNFIARWRKISMQGQQRMKSRANVYGRVSMTIYKLI